MNATTVAIDLAKDVFELAFADAGFRIVERKRVLRNAFAGLFENRAPLHIVMEACGSAHYWARRFERLGHRVTLSMPICSVSRRTTCAASDISRPVASA